MMNEKMNEMLVNYSSKVFISRGKSVLDKSILATMLKNLEALGYTLSKKAIHTLATNEEDYAVDFYNNLYKLLKQMTGANKKFSPMYPNFPKQVMEASDAELYINAIMHYFGDWIGVRILPDYEKEERNPLLEKTELKVLDLAIEDDIHEIFNNLMRSKTSLSEYDRDNINWYIEEYRNEAYIPSEIPHKEVLVGVLKQCLFFDVDIKLKMTATDILRFSVVLSDGDVSLSEVTKFRNFTREERRYILSLIDNCSGNIEEEMYKYKNRWLRLGERLHPGDYAKRYQRAYSAFDKLRNQNKIETYNSKLEIALLNGNITEAVGLLKAKPGVFARKLDHLLRTVKDNTSRENIIDVFEEVASSVSTAVLWQVRTHFLYRNEEDIRVFIPKGMVSKMYAKENDLKYIDDNICDKIVKVCDNALRENYSYLDDMGNVYLDEELKNYNIPFSQRSSSKSLKTITRGSKIDFGTDKDVIRFFIWWNQNSDSGRIDIDLSATSYDEDWGYVGHVSWTNLRDGMACHSGDITSAPQGACEFIDLNLNNCPKHIRYITMNIYSFTGQNFCDIPECFAGWMMRKKPQSGEIFEAKTVENKFDVVSSCKACIPLVIDVVDRKVIWADIASMSRMVELNKKHTSIVGQSITNIHKANLYDLFKTHIEARNGNTVENTEDADIVFSVKNGIKPTDISTIVGEYL